jgi:ribosomal protein L37AE/L43A
MKPRAVFTEANLLGSREEAPVTRPEACPACNGRKFETLARVITATSCWRCRLCDHTWTIGGAAGNRPTSR